MASVEELLESEGEDEFEGFEPFGYDEASWKAWALEEYERCEREKEEKKQKEEEKERRGKAHQKVKDSIIEFDPKVGREVYTRFFLRDFSLFDINEKSPIPPMRYADRMYAGEFELQDSVNILSVSIVSSDEGFPVNVYGSVIARDSIDYKCIDLFHRDRDDCQPIDAEGGMLVLTGPGRGLVLVDFIYLEIDLKIKQDGVFPDKQFSKGLISIDGRVISREKDVVVRSETLDSFLSTMEVRFATVLESIEVHFEIKLVEGDFNGKITASIFETEETIVIHDSRADGVVKCDESGDINIKLRRCVFTVCESSRAVQLHFENNAGGVKSERAIPLVPYCIRYCLGRDHLAFTCGDGLFCVEYVWSLMDFRP